MTLAGFSQAGSQLMAMETVFVRQLKILIYLPHNCLLKGGVGSLFLKHFSPNLFKLSLYTNTYMLPIEVSVVLSGLQ